MAGWNQTLLAATRPDQRAVLRRHIRPFSHDPNALKQYPIFDPDNTRHDAPLHAEDVIPTERLLASLELPAPRTYEQQVAEVFKNAFAEQRLSLEDMMPALARAAWRITRHLAQNVYCICHEDELLAEAFYKPDAQEPDAAWHTPRSPKGSPKLAFSALRAFLHESPPIPLAPPRLPEEFRVAPDHPPHPDYDPQYDEMLNLYCLVVAKAAADLAVAQGSYDDPYSNARALSVLTDPNLVRVAFPSPGEIMSFEVIAVEEALGLIVDRGAMYMQRELLRRHGYRGFEMQSLIKLAKVYAASYLTGDVENDRAVMLLRLEEYCRRAREGLDLRSELGGLKQMAIVQGLARIETGDQLTDIVNTVRAFQGKNALAPVDSELQKRLPPPGGEVIDVDSNPSP